MEAQLQDVNWTNVSRPVLELTFSRFRAMNSTQADSSLGSWNRRAILKISTTSWVSRFSAITAPHCFFRPGSKYSSAVYKTSITWSSEICKWEKSEFRLKHCKDSIQMLRTRLRKVWCRKPTKLAPKMQKRKIRHASLARRPVNRQNCSVTPEQCSTVAINAQFKKGMHVINQN